eukprot:212250_1
MKSVLGLGSRLRCYSTAPINHLRRASVQYTIVSASAFATLSQTVPSASPPTESHESKEEIHFHEMVQEYYGKTLSTSADLKTNACCTAAAPPLRIRQALKQIPKEITDKYYGCGSPLPFGIEGLTILDLGSGSGRDCYIASQLVGEEGKVIGVDMTDEQLDVSRKYSDSFCTRQLGYKQSNLEFIKGYIETLPHYLEPQSIDIIISNCVVNLSPRKDKVLSGAYTVLKEGGEFYFSDVYCDRRLSEEIRNHKVLVGECLGGALYVEDFRRICQSVGFMDPRVLSISEIKVEDGELKSILGNAKFYSITYRLFKQKQIEDKCEDFGQVAIYKGSIDEHKDYYDLDDHHRFIAFKPMLVCGNTANMVGQTWLAPHFEVFGDMSIHFGLFDCSPVTSSAGNSDSKVGGSCC